LGLLRDIQSRLRNLPEAGSTLHHARPSSRDLKTELTCLIGQLQPLADSCPQALLSDLRRSLTAMHDKLGEIPTAVTAEEHLQDFEEALVADAAADLRQLRKRSNPERIALIDLPPAQRERYVGQTGTCLLQDYGQV